MVGGEYVMNLNSKRAIFLDFYGTVVYEDGEPIRDIVSKLCQDNTSTKDISAHWGQRFSELCNASKGEAFRLQRDLEIRSLQDTIAYFGLQADALELSKPQFDYWCKPPIFDDSLSFFSDCELPIYIVSNIDTADLLSAIKYHGLSPAGIVTSEEARCYKPNRRIFDYALNKFGVSPSAVIHIGDSRTSDILGAKTAGIDAVWLNRKGRKTNNLTVQMPSLSWALLKGLMI
jgi:2-haloacid dehalogenase/putative hydrolase of the HAD superfamily